MNDLLEYITTKDAHYFSKVTYDVMYETDQASKKLFLPWVPVVEGNLIDTLQFYC